MLAVAGAVLAVTTGLAAASSTGAAATGPSNTAPPTLSGSAQQGSTLSTSSGSWSGSPTITFTFAWDRCDSAGASCVAIAGETGQTYTVAIGDVGHTLESVVTAHNSGGTASAASAPTAVVTGATPPQNTGAPQISGATSVGSTDTATAGTWTGTSPISYAYQWTRCGSTGGSCASIGGATKTTYVLTSGDTGHTLRVQVTATNAGGTAQATSAATGVVAVVVTAPANTAAPAVSGTATQGQTLTTTTGTWTGATPMTFTYSWLRCDTSQKNCSTISGATASKYTLTSSDVGRLVVALVTAANSVGSARVNSNFAGPVAASTPAPPPPPTQPSGTTKLPNGETSIAAANVPDTDRLLVKSVRFSPARIAGRAPVTATLKILDSHGYDVSGALVYVLGLPYGWAKAGPEAATAADGTVTISITPTRKMPRRGSLVLFVRARTPQGDVLAGSSSRRLVQVLIRP